MRPTTRRELVVAATATALTAAVPPVWGRMTSRRARLGPGRFLDGVASGEPSPTAVTFWSKLRTDRPRGGARLIVATDEGLDDVVATAVVPTGPGIDNTLKTRIGGLEPATEYFYAWESTSDHSPTGRTRTRPPDDSATGVRVGYSSCQHYSFGYFSPHQHAAAEELDLYVFLGDYVYEKGRTITGSLRLDRTDAVDLRSYRRKYRTYRSDPGLRELHRLHPVVHIWDDHEVFNNYSRNAPPLSASQRTAGYRAAFEWLPRMAYPRDRYRIYKRMHLGAHVDLFLLDTRQYRTGDGDGRARHILDEKQMQWLIRGLKASKARWKVIANQVVITQDPFGTGESTDQWDGYPGDRFRLLSEIERAGLRDVVFITGDAHVYLCSLLGTDFEAVATDPRRVPAGVEYVGGSISTPGVLRDEAEARLYAPWIQQFNSRDHGYAIFAANDGALVTEFRRSDLSSSGGGTVPFERFVQPAGVNRVARESFDPPFPPPAPAPAQRRRRRV